MIKKSSALKLNCRWFEDFQQDSRFVCVMIILYQVMFDYFGGWLNVYLEAYIFCIEDLLG